MGPWSWGLALRCYRVVLVAAAVSSALAGALVLPPYVVLLIAPLCGVVVAGLVGLTHPAQPDALSARRVVAVSGTAATVLLPAVAGVGQFGALGMTVVVALMLTGWIVLGGPLADLREPAGSRTDRVLDEAELEAFVRMLPLAMLLGEWRATGDDLRAGCPGRRAQAAMVRKLLLEEFSRRDPAGVVRWLSEGDGEPPEQYVRGDSDATT